LEVGENMTVIKNFLSINFWKFNKNNY
jgi:hypothetical protein